MAYVRLESFMHGAICTRLSAVSFIARYYTPKRRSKAGACAGYWWQTAKTIELVPDTFSPTEGSSLDKRSEMCKLLVWQDPKKACIPASIQLRVTKCGARAVLLPGFVASGSGSVVRDFEDVDGFIGARRN